MKVAALMLAYNCLELSKRTIESIEHQDIECPFLIVNNASTDGTYEWIVQRGYTSINSATNLGITAGWNAGLRLLFGCGCDYVLTVNNDVVLPSWFAGELASYDQPLVTGIDTDNMEDLVRIPTQPLVPYPDFSAYMIRRDTWEMVGEFDERLFNYCSDCDYHIRAHRLGLKFSKAVVRYYHQRSSTINLAPPEEKAWMEARADRDRDVFKSIYGCLPGTKEYLALLGLV